MDYYVQITALSGAIRVFSLTCEPELRPVIDSFGDFQLDLPGFLYTPSSSAGWAWVFYDDPLAMTFGTISNLGEHTKRSPTGCLELTSASAG
jgi:hypothetical protein